ncbi:DUF4403 family protein [Bradyrhizobium retamae]|uniref:DUF4403 domain-containing protein n=1 Tax=Bradyrhizobium retamae TaxID=1300035 RepID=A0A0R3MFS7_9BRAD|nr:DUF4403 family protein [Bradyrhizobium retamae]KRR18858.1 hypothetical protein CQ13_10530 [Bradyrhizobium retamae]
MRVKTIAIALAVLVVSFAISLKVMDFVAPRATNSAPALAELPPLPPAARASTVMAPIAVALSAIRDAADRGAPRNFAGKADNPISQILQNADIGWTASRGSISATGAQDVLSLVTPLTGTLNVTGSLSAKATGAVGEALGSLLGGNVSKQIGSVNIKNLNASAEIKGNVVISARPQIATNWRVEPNLAAQVNLGDTSLSVAGARVNVPAQVKPLIDQNVAEQIALVQARMRNDPTLERNARVQWAKACRSIPLQGTTAGSTMPALWLELRPTRAIAAQPRVDASNLTLTLGIEAETRITPSETKPSCPFPATIAMVPPTPGRVAIGVPIDMPFTEINKIVEAQFAGKTFPEDGSGAVYVTVKRATVAASGNRLLISLLVSAKEKTSFLGLGGEANVHIWGKPVLDQGEQTLRLTDIELAIESEAAFGLLGAAARAAIPHLQRTLADKAVVDLKPFAGNAQKKIAAAIADLQKNEDGLRVSAEISKLRLAGIAFDSKTLRVIAEAEGAINVYVSALPAL